MKKFLFMLMLLPAMLFAQQEDSTVVVAAGQEGNLAYNEGLQKFQENKYKEAIEKFTEAIKYDPNFSKAYFIQ